MFAGLTALAPAPTVEKGVLRDCGKYKNKVVAPDAPTSAEYSHCPEDFGAAGDTFMATPDNRDPNQRKEDAELRDIEKIDVRRGWYGRGGGGWVWLWIWVIIIVVAFFWYAGWGWGAYGGWWGWNGRTPVVVTTGSGVAVLNSDNKAPFVGHSFDLRGARVQTAVTNNVFWVGNGRSRPMLLVVVNNPVASATPIAAGDLVAASGTVEKAPPAAQAKNEWHLNDTGVRQLEAQQVYLQSPYVSQLQRQPANGKASNGAVPNSEAANRPQ